MLNMTLYMPKISISSWLPLFWSSDISDLVPLAPNVNIHFLMPIPFHVLGESDLSQILRYLSVGSWVKGMMLNLARENK